MKLFVNNIKLLENIQRKERKVPFLTKVNFTLTFESGLNLCFIQTAKFNQLITLIDKPLSYRTNDAYSSGANYLIEFIFSNWFLRHQVTVLEIEPN